MQPLASCRQQIDTRYRAVSFDAIDGSMKDMRHGNETSRAVSTRKTHVQANTVTAYILPWPQPTDGHTMERQTSPLPTKHLGQSFNANGKR